MLKRISEKWAQFMINNGAEESERAVYVYGMQCLLNESVSDILLLTGALLLHRVWEMAIWIAVFNFLRMNTGGYHAQTPARCIGASTLLGLFCIRMYPLLTGLPVLSAVIVILSLITVVRLAPVPNRRHPVSEERRRAAGRRAVAGAAVTGGAVVMFSSDLTARVSWLQNLSAVLLTALAAVAVLAFLGSRATRA